MARIRITMTRASRGIRKRNSSSGKTKVRKKRK